MGFCLRIIVNETHINFEKTTYSVLSVISINLWSSHSLYSIKSKNSERDNEKIFIIYFYVSNKKSWIIWIVCFIWHFIIITIVCLEFQEKYDDILGKRCSLFSPWTKNKEYEIEEEIFVWCTITAYTISYSKYFLYK